MFRVNTFVTVLVVLFHRGENKQAGEEIHSLPYLKLSKHEIVWKQHTGILNRARDDSKRYAVPKAFFARKGRTDITRPQTELLSPVKTRVWYRKHESELVNGFYHADNARAHLVFYHKENHLKTLCHLPWCFAHCLLSNVVTDRNIHC